MRARSDRLPNHIAVLDYFANVFDTRFGVLIFWTLSMRGMLTLKCPSKNVPSRIPARAFLVPNSLLEILLKGS